MFIQKQLLNVVTLLNKLGYEHDSILFDLQDVDEPINILNIDQHHDICYVNEQYNEVHRIHDIVMQPKMTPVNVFCG